MSKHRFFIPVAAFALAFSACTDAPIAPDTDIEPQLAKGGGGGGGDNTGAELSNYMDALNAGLAADGADYRVAMAEYVTSGDSGEMGNTIIAKNVGNKQLGFDFVPGDTRRAWSGPGANSITYAIDTTGDSGPRRPMRPSSARWTPGMHSPAPTWD